MSKLEILAEIEGTTVFSMLEEATFDSVAPGICNNPDCNYSTEVEPDCNSGYCEECQTDTVVSCLILANLL